MKRPQLQALQSRSNLLGMLALASLCFVLGAHWGQRRSLQAAPAALAASGPLQQAATALEVAVDSGGVAAASSAAQDLGSLRGQAREVLESNTAAGSSALEAAADAQPATAAGGAGEGAQQAAKWGSNSDPQPDVVTRVLEIRPAPAKKVPGMAGRIPKASDAKGAVDGRAQAQHAAACWAPQGMPACIGLHEALIGLGPLLLCRSSTKSSYPQSPTPACEATLWGEPPFWGRNTVKGGAKGWWSPNRGWAAQLQCWPPASVGWPLKAGDVCLRQQGASRCTR